MECNNLTSNKIILVMIALRHGGQGKNLSLRGIVTVDQLSMVVSV